MFWCVEGAPSMRDMLDSVGLGSGRLARGVMKIQLLKYFVMSFRAIMGEAV